MAYTYTYEDRSVKRRRKLKFWSLLIPNIIFLLLFFSFAIWRIKPEPKCRIVVVDKTVPHPDYREHKALFWVLNHAKVINEGGKRPWKSSEDYVGFYPEKFVATDASYSSELNQSHLDGIACLFIVDTYGVYVDDYEFADNHRTHLDFSQKIYGGLEPAEVEVIESFIQAGGALVAEFNTFYQPTPESLGERMERLLGLRSTGWRGRYFADLANRQDVPSWAVRNWKALHNKEWDFSGPGFIIAQSDTMLLVLKEGEDVESRGLEIQKNFPDDPLMKGVSSHVPYQYWFDVTLPEDGTEILAQYRFFLKPSGREKLKEYSIPDTFPAVLRASRSPLRIYFAGDFSDSRIYQGPYFFYGWPSIRRFLSSFGQDRSYSRFFWSFYVPFLKNSFKSIM